MGGERTRVMETDWALAPARQRADAVRRHQSKAALQSRRRAAPVARLFKVQPYNRGSSGSRIIGGWIKHLAERHQGSLPSFVVLTAIGLVVGCSKESWRTRYFCCFSIAGHRLSRLLQGPACSSLFPSHFARLPVDLPTCLDGPNSSEGLRESL
jgi:hypothetical protein